MLLKRAATPHTLHYGSVRIAIVDVRCSSCENLLRYNGEWGVLFSYSAEKFLQLSCLTDGLTRSVRKVLHSVIPSTLGLKGVAELLREFTNSTTSHYSSADKLTTHCPRF